MDRRDEWHDRVRAWWEAQGDAVRVPVTVLGEICYLIGTRLGARLEEGFVRGIVDGEFPLEALDPHDPARAADLMRSYADFPLGFVDASIVAMAERLETTTILTTDRRHFGVVRPAHCERLRLVP